MGPDAFPGRIGSEPSSRLPRNPFPQVGGGLWVTCGGAYPKIP